jgi:PAS domain S-box-containing protein
MSATPIRDAADRITSVVVTHHDISDIIHRQQMIEKQIVQLQRQNSLLNRQAKLLDLSGEAIFAWELNGPIIYWNQGAEKIYGYTADEAIGCIPHILLKPQVPGGGEQIKASLLETGSWTGYAEQTSKDGRVRIIETRMQVIPNASGADTVLETNRDVTEKIGVENEMKKKHGGADKHHQQHRRLYLVRGCRLQNHPLQSGIF